MTFNSREEEYTRKTENAALLGKVVIISNWKGALTIKM